nr:Smr/MutS family protein [Pseudomonas sp.]
MKKARKHRGYAPQEPLPPKNPVSPQFAGLKALHRTLVENQQAQALERARQEQQRTIQRHNAEDFRRMVGKVVPLKDNGRAQPKVAAPLPLPFQRWADDHAVLRESVSDEYGAEWLLETDESLSYRRTGLGPDIVRKLRRGHWTVAAQLDLHGMRVDEAREAVAEFLRECVRQERRCVRIIHGKGLGSANRIPVLKEKVRRWLTQKEEVLAFVEARPDDGGSGVVLALLKPRYGSQAGDLQV